MLMFLTNAEERRNLQMISGKNHVYEINSLLIKFLKQKKLITLSLLRMSEEVTRSWFQLGTQTSVPLLTFSSHCVPVNCFKKSRCKEKSLKRNVQQAVPLPGNSRNA